MSKIRQAKLCFLLATVLSLPFKPSLAAEGTTPVGPVGGTDIRQALLPPPGLYGGIVGVGATLGPDYYLNNGGTTKLYDSFDALAGVGLLYVYNLNILGGSVASSVSAGYANLCFGLSKATRKCATGFKDSYTDLFLWSRFLPSRNFTGERVGGAAPIPYGLAVAFGLGLEIPTGEYRSNNHVNVGSDFWDFTPNVALTYNVPSLFGPFLGQATEFSARLFYHAYTTNNATDYHTGDLLNLDFAVTQRANRWQFGLAGEAYGEVQDDTIRGEQAPGHRTVDLGFGPVVSYDFRAAGHPWSFKVKSLNTVLVRNQGGANSIIVSLATKF